MKDKKPIAGIIMESLKGPMPKEDEMNPEHEIAKDIMDTISAKDPMMLSEALKAAFQSFESQPHGENEEGME